MYVCTCVRITLGKRKIGKITSRATKTWGGQTDECARITLYFHTHTTQKKTKLIRHFEEALLHPIRPTTRRDISPSLEGSPKVELAKQLPMYNVQSSPQLALFMQNTQRAKGVAINTGAPTSWQVLPPAPRSNRPSEITLTVTKLRLLEDARSMV